MIIKQTVSIIVPIYNAGFSLHGCINSILNQTHRSIELILINDGSTDYSGMICDAYAKTDRRVGVIHQKNAGPSKARNTGIDAATGNYIQFVDSDDNINPDMTEKLVRAMKKDVQLVICGYATMYRNTRSGGRSYIPAIHGVYQQEQFLQHIGRLYKQVLLPSPCNKMYRTDIIQENAIRFTENLHLGEDLLFNLDYVQHCNAVNLIQDQLYNYVINNNQSLSRKFTKDLLDNQHMLHLSVKEFLIKNQCFDGKNKNLLHTIYANSIIQSINNLFHENSKLTPTEIKERISKIVSDEIVRQHIPYFKDSMQARMVGQMIKHKSINGLYLFFIEKKALQYKMHPLFNALKKMNGR